MEKNNLRQGLLLALLLAPGVGFLLIFFGWPLASTLVGSLQLEDGGFTLKWYETIFSRPSMQRGMRTSIYYGVAPVIVSTFCSIPLALMLRSSFLGRKLFNGLYKVPLAVPSIIVSVLVITLLERGGFMARLIAPLGLSMPKLVRDDWAVGAILAMSWKQIPFMTLVITSSFAAIPEDLKWAARTLGASRLKALLLVEIPLAMPGITAAVLLTFIGSMGAFALPDLVGPPTARAMSVLMVHEFNQGNFHQVFAMGMILTLFAILVLFGYYTLTAGIGRGGRRKV